MLIDTSAWIEFFQGSLKGEKVRNVLNSFECFTSMLTITEVTRISIRNRIDYRDRIKRIKKMSKIIAPNEEISILAGKLAAEHLRVADSLICATAKVYGLKLLTADNDFRDFEGVEML